MRDLLHDPIAATQKGVRLDARSVSHVKGFDTVHHHLKIRSVASNTAIVLCQSR